MREFKIHPHNPVSCFTMKGYHTWCASVTRDPQGKFHLYASAWPEETGHNGWVTHSMIVHATSDDPLGPFEYCNVVLGSQEEDVWDRDVAHNPTVIQANGKWYLYYMGNQGNGEFWDHRNKQRIGVAVANHPDGPFERQTDPLLLPGRDGAWDDLLTTNPSCTQAPDGRFVLIYKAVSSKGEAPRYGSVRHGVAFSSSPTGPFEKHPEPIFQCPGATFAAEDPFLWCQDGRFFCILKDMAHNFTGHERALVLFSSADAMDWALEEHPIVSTRRILQADGIYTEYERMERPQLYLEDGLPSVLYAAVKPERDSDKSYNIHLRIEFANGDSNIRP